MATSTADHLRRQIDYTVLPGIRAVGRCQDLTPESRNLREKYGTLRRKLFECLTIIEQNLFSRQSQTVYRQLRSIRTTIVQILRSLPVEGNVDARLLEQAHVDLQLEPIMCPDTVDWNGTNRISHWI